MKYEVKVEYEGRRYHSKQDTSVIKLRKKIR
jgi:hypothetical protein